MIVQRLPLQLGKQLAEPFRKRINRAPSPFLAYCVPWLSVMLGSLSPHWPLIASAPIVPPMGLLILLGWMQLRRGLLPIWVGLPLGAFDDLFSGQPFGSAILAWSLAMIVLDVIEGRFPWRHFLFDWWVGALIVTAVLVLAWGLANIGGGSTDMLVIVPQIALSACLIPLTGLLVSLLDRFRLLPIKSV